MLLRAYHTDFDDDTTLLCFGEARMDANDDEEGKPWVVHPIQGEYYQRKCFNSLIVLDSDSEWSSW